MATMLFTEISLRSLKGSERYETHFDTKTPGFGIRCGLRSKTFLVMRGKGRERVTLGRFPDMSLADARAEAKRLLAAAPAAKTVRRTFESTRDEFLDERYKHSTSDHRYHQELTLKKHFKALDNKQLSDITDSDVEAALAKIKGPSAKLHAFRAVRTLFNWCVKSPRRYIPSPRSTATTLQAAIRREPASLPTPS